MNKKLPPIFESRTRMATAVTMDNQLPIVVLLADTNEMAVCTPEDMSADDRRVLLGFALAAILASLEKLEHEEYRQ